MRTVVNSGSNPGADISIPPADRPVVREYAFDCFRINVPYCQVWHEEHLVPLTPKAFDTLVFLIAHRDHIVSKEELMTALWPNSLVSEDALTQNIWAIRRALGDDAGKQQFIATIPRRGYRFMAPVVERYLEPYEPAIDTSEQGHTDDVTAASAPHASPSSRAAHASPSVDPPATATALPYDDAPRTRAGRGRWYALAGVTLLAIISVLWLTQPSQGERIAATPSGLVRFTQESPRGATLVSGGQLSPDGRQLAFVAQDERSGETHIWLRNLDAAEARPLPGTEGALRPFWSPDGRQIGFFAWRLS